MRLSVFAVISAMALFGLSGVAEAQTKSSMFKNVRWNGTKPSFAEGIHTFELLPRHCGKKTYGDGRGESDCGGGRVRSQIRTKKHVRVGQTVQYTFEFFVPKSFKYDGDRSFPAYSRLLIAEWNRDRGIKNHIYEILLDSRRGATFERKVCVRPGEFGQWNEFTLLIKWSKGSDGFLEARCNGQVVLKRTNTQTVIPPDCAAEYKLQCDPKTQVPNANIGLNIGPNLSGYGRNYRELRTPRSSPFAPFPPNGVKIQFRNIYIGRPK